MDIVKLAKDIKKIIPDEEFQWKIVGTSNSGMEISISQMIGKFNKEILLTKGNIILRTAQNSILKSLSMLDDDVSDIEQIGWLYRRYQIRSEENDKRNRTKQD